MGYYYRLCGWIQVSDLKYKKLTETIIRLQEEHKKSAEGEITVSYMDGWSWNAPSFNWGAFIYYGGKVRYKGLILFESVLGELVAQKCECSGFFHAQGEDDEYNISYHIYFDRLTINKDAKPLIFET